MWGNWGGQVTPLMQPQDLPANVAENKNSHPVGKRVLGPLRALNPMSAQGWAQAYWESHTGPVPTSATPHPREDRRGPV